MLLEFVDPLEDKYLSTATISFWSGVKVRSCFPLPYGKGGRMASQSLL